MRDAHAAITITPVIYARHDVVIAITVLEKIDDTPLGQPVSPLRRVLYY